MGYKIKCPKCNYKMEISTYTPEKKLHYKRNKEEIIKKQIEINKRNRKRKKDSTVLENDKK